MTRPTPDEPRSVCPVCSAAHPWQTSKVYRPRDIRPTRRGLGDVAVFRCAAGHTWETPWIAGLEIR
jgi:hypothetical protein